MDVREAINSPPTLDDSAAREWQRKGAELNVPPPTFSITFKAEDGTVLVWDREARKWVPLKR